MDTRDANQQKTVAEPKANGPAKPASDGFGPVDAAALPARPRRRIFFIIAASIVIVAALIWGLPWLNFMLSHEGTDDAHVGADEVAVTSKIPERIDRILVDTNQPVDRGQLLIVLDNKDELAKLRQAQAQYDLAAANQRATTEQGQGGISQASGAIANVQAQVPVAQDVVAQANAQLHAAQAQVPAAQQAYDKTQADLNRASSLVSTGDVASQQLDAARAQAAGAAAQLRARARPSQRRARQRRRGARPRPGCKRRGVRGVWRTDDRSRETLPGGRSQPSRGRSRAALSCQAESRLHAHLRSDQWLRRRKERRSRPNGRRRDDAHDDRPASYLHHRKLQRDANGRNARRASRSTFTSMRIKA